MKRSKADAEKTRAAVIKAAVRSFNLKGYAATRLSDIAREIGHTRGAIYWHFKSKLELYRCLVEMSIQQLETVIEYVFQIETPFLDRIEHFFKEIMILKQKMDYKFHFFEEVLFGAGRLAELQPIADRVAIFIAQIHRFFSDKFKKAQDRGELSKLHSSGDLAWVMMLHLRGMSDRDDPIIQINENQYRLYIDLMIEGMGSLRR